MIRMTNDEWGEEAFGWEVTLVYEGGVYAWGRLYLCGMDAGAMKDENWKGGVWEDHCSGREWALGDVKGVNRCREAQRDLR